ncbi:MAG: EAL domain-containing protein [Lachnospiraceae bacterium]|nr:EAL domain-containing protein [Lachnospiraceae bacterium]
MTYNYSFEIAATIIMFLLLFTHLINPNFEMAKSRAFFFFLIAGICESILNVLSSWGLVNTHIVSSDANNIICFLFFLAEAATSLLFFRYVTILCEPARKKRVLYAQLAIVPCALFLLILFTNDIFHLLYKIEDNVYSQGKLAWYGYAYIGLYILASFAVSITAKRTIRGRNRYAVLLAASISLIGVLIQYNIKNVLLTGFANAIILSLFYIFIQNPNELHDKATGISNNRALYLRFENGLNIEKPMRVLLFDLHQSSQLNVMYGYRIGNSVLSEIGAFFAETVGSSNAFRVSDSVFAAILKSDKEVERVRLLAEERFSKTWDIDNIQIGVPLKMACIKYPEDVLTTKDFYGLEVFVKQLLRKDSMTTYLDISPEIKKQYIRLSEVDVALKKALEDKSLEVYFQPIFSVKENHFNSLEALARMFDKELGFVPPDEFISRAEYSGLIIPLDLMILDKTCDFIEKKILPNNERLKIESVHINISALQCLQPNMDKAILDIIDRHKVPREMIILEITERAAVTAAEIMERHMRNLKNCGIRFALDDYGTGNSNCSYLIDYPFDKVKFDKSMVWAYFKSKTGKIILDGEMKTIHNLNIPIVAEGVETAEQIDAMNLLNVDSIQGYFYSKPLPGDELLDFLFRQDITTT